MNIRAIAFGVGFALGGASAWAGVGVWSGQGPEGGYVFDILQDPSAIATLYVSTRSGIFKSTDAGASWAPRMNGIVGSVSYGYPLAIDADAPNTLYAADSTGHLYRTGDGAASWTQTGYVLPPLANGTVQINQITDAPATTARLYLATLASGILASDDGGATFSPLNGSGGTSLPAGIPFQTVAVDPANPLNLLAGPAFADLGPGPNGQALYRSTDGGVHWTGVFAAPAGNPLYNPNDPSCSLPSPPPNVCIIATETYYPTVTDITFGNGSEVYANADGGIVRSTDSGATWNPVVTADSNVANFLMTLKADSGTPNAVFAGGYFGLKRSTDGGVTFADVATAANGLSPNGVDVATVSRLVRSGSTWWLATQEAGMFKSIDSGANWSSDNSGLEATNIRALGMVPITASPPRILAGYGDALRPSPGMYGGSDAGDGNLSWESSNAALRAYQIRAIAVDPTTANGTPGTTIVYAGGRSESAAAIAPRNGGLYKSGDGGSTWTTIDTGLPQRVNGPTPFLGTVRSMLLDPHSCTGYPACTSALNTVYAASNGCFLYSALGPTAGGTAANIGKCGSPFDTRYTGSYEFRILKSSDGGANWTNSDSGIPQSFPGTQPYVSDFESLIVVPLVIDPINTNVLYAGTVDSFDPAYVANPTLQTGIFKSTDSGATWNPVNTGLPAHAAPSTTIHDVSALAIDPNTPTTLWAAIIDLNVVTTARIYKTTDGGSNWNDSSTGLTSADIRALLIDPTDSNILYAGGGGTVGNPGSVFKSYDGGATWHSISVGLPADAALALALDPGDHNKLYAGTNSGVWEITQTVDSDFDGVSDIQEDLGPNGGDSNLDGIPDRNQPDVTYVPPHQSAAAPTRAMPQSAPANNDFAVQITAQAGPTCVQIQDVQSKSAGANGPDRIASNTISSLEYDYAADLLQFEVVNCAATTVKVTYPNVAFGPGWTFRFYGPETPGNDASIKWYDFSADAVKVDAHSWQLTLTRGAFGSYRPEATGAILFQGGPAYNDRLFDNGFN